MTSRYVGELPPIVLPALLDIRDAVVKAARTFRAEFNVADMMGSARTSLHVAARRAYYVAARNAGYSWLEIAAGLGQTNHSSALTAWQRVQQGPTNETGELTERLIGMLGRRRSGSLHPDLGGSEQAQRRLLAQVAGRSGE